MSFNSQPRRKNPAAGVLRQLSHELGGQALEIVGRIPDLPAGRTSASVALRSITTAYRRAFASAEGCLYGLKMGSQFWIVLPKQATTGALAPA